MSDQTIAAAVTAAVSDDAELRGRVASFVNRAISQAEGLLLTGSPQVQAQLIRSVVPAMVKAMTVDDSPDEHADMRAEFEELMTELRSGVADPSLPAASALQPPEDKPKRKRKASDGA